MSSGTVEPLNKGHLRKEGFDPYSEVTLCWEVFNKELFIVLLWLFTTYLNDYDMKPLCLRLEKQSEATLFKRTSSIGRLDKYLPIKRVKQRDCVRT